MAHWKSLASGKTRSLKACLRPPRSRTLTTARLSNSYRHEYLNLKSNVMYVQCVHMLLSFNFAKFSGEICGEGSGACGKVTPYFMLGESF